MIKIYSDFDTIEADVKANAPQIVYKYRTWEVENHKKIITSNELWLSHPFKLNDPFDVRPPYKFVTDHIDWKTVKEKLRIVGKYTEPGIPDYVLEMEVEKRYQEMIADPEAYFSKNREMVIQDEALFGRVGVLSCCMSAENEAMWAHYGNNHQGFAVGFDTVALAKVVGGQFGQVNYSNDPLNYYCMGDNSHLMEQEVFQKSTKWKEEEEFRFATYGIGWLRSRSATFPAHAVKEIVFGISTTPEVEAEIRALATKQFPGVEFYRVVPNTTSYGLRKVKV